MRETFREYKAPEQLRVQVASPLLHGKTVACHELRDKIGNLLKEASNRPHLITLDGQQVEFTSVLEISEYIGAMGISVQNLATATNTIREKIDRATVK